MSLSKEEQIKKINEIMPKKSYWVRGKTYMKRETLKKMGAKWVEAEKAWLLEQIREDSPSIRLVDMMDEVYLEEIK